MIIGHALGEELKGFTVKINGKDEKIQYEYGDKDALDKFIAFKNKNNSKKYPLVFYVTAKVNDVGGKLSSDTQLVILKDTKEESLSRVRVEETFIKYIEPIYKALMKKIELSRTISIERKGFSYDYEDKANFGITNKGLTQKKSSESIVTDYVDGRIIYVKITKNCN